jgi:pSer/pThr/pTyr-binding forkhead associated (FHA) protein
MTMFKLIFKNNQREAFELKQGRNTLGRNETNSVVLDAGGVSDYHADIQVEEETAVLIDLASTNGTYLNGKRISGRTPVKSFDVIRIDTVEIEVVDPGMRRPTVVRAAVTDAGLTMDRDATRVDPAISGWSLMGTTGAFKYRLIPLSGLVKVGREKDCDLVLDSIEISREHALIEVAGGTLTVRDQGSANGTYVNDERVTDAILRDGDEVRFDVIAFRVHGPGDSGKTWVRPAVGAGAAQGRDSTWPADTVVTPSLGERPVLTEDPSPRKSTPLQSNAASAQTAYILNAVLPGAGNIYFGQPIIGTIFIFGILLGLFMLFFGASAAMIGILIIIVSVIAAFFTLGLSLIVGLPIGVIFLMMGAGPIVAFIIWLFSLITSEILVSVKANKSAAPEKPQVS